MRATPPPSQGELLDAGLLCRGIEWAGDLSGSSPIGLVIEPQSRPPRWAYSDPPLRDPPDTKTHWSGLRSMRSPLAPAPGRSLGEPWVGLRPAWPHPRIGIWGLWPYTPGAGYGQWSVFLATLGGGDQGRYAGAFTV
jgi:hypothetical protein